MAGSYETPNDIENPKPHIWRKTAGSYEAAPNDIENPKPHIRRKMVGSYQVAPNDIENPKPHIRRKMGGSYQAAPNDIVTSMKKVLDSLPPMSSNRCIYRVPDRQRRVNENVYTPRVVSIGPLHQDKESLKAMEEHKYRYLRDFLHRTNISLEDYVKRIKEQEEILRGCYAETIKFSSDEFVTIILVDAAFIIELLLRSLFKDLNDVDNHIYGKSWMLPDIVPDLLLLENQLPFFILVDLLEGVSSKSNNIESFSMMNLSHHFFARVLGIQASREGSLARISSSQVEHLLDFVRRICLPFELQALGKSNNVTAPSMTELHQAGVKFEVRSTQSLFDIRFTHDGVLKIPYINIDHNTERTLRNLLAFEQCHFFDSPSEFLTMSYLRMLDCLVNTAKDVELLSKHEIIYNGLGESSEVSTLINSLFLGASGNPADFYYDTICVDLNKYCKKSWHKWKANLKQNYFNTPCATMSVIAAVVLLILTLIQTICSIISLN